MLEKLGESMKSVGKGLLWLSLGSIALGVTVNHFSSDIFSVIDT